MIGLSTIKLNIKNILELDITSASELGIESVLKSELSISIRLLYIASALRSNKKNDTRVLALYIGASKALIINNQSLYALELYIVNSLIIRIENISTSTNSLIVEIKNINISASASASSIIEIKNINTSTSTRANLIIRIEDINTNSNTSSIIRIENINTNSNTSILSELNKYSTSKALIIIFLTILYNILISSISK